MFMFPNIFTTYQGPQSTFENTTHFIYKDYGDLTPILPFLLCLSHSGKVTPENTLHFLKHPDFTL